MSVQAQHVEFEEQKGLGRRLVVTLGANEIDKAYQKHLLDTAKNIRLPGFRSGNNPMKRKVVEKRYGQQLYQECVGKMTEETLKTIFEKKALEPANTPEVDFLEDTRGQDVRYAVTFDVFPDVSWDDLKSLKVKVASSEVSEEAVEKGMEKVRDDQRDWQEVDEPCGEGMQVTFDVLCQDGDEVILDTRERPESIVWGKDEVLPDIKKALKGKTAGDTVEFTLSFPKDFHHKDMQGKKVHCVLKVHHVKTSTLPEMDEAFFEKVGVPEKTQAAFAEQVKEPLGLELDKKLYAINRERLFAALLKHYKVELPESLVKQELEDIQKQNEQQPEKERKKDKELLKIAEKNVKLLVLIRSYLKAHDMRLDPKRFDEYVKSMAFPFMDEKAFLRWFYSDKNMVQRAQSEVLERQVVEACLQVVKQDAQTLKYDQVDGVLSKEQE